MLSGVDATKLLPILATLMMVVGLLYDLKTAKYPNKIFLISVALAIVVVIAIGGFSALGRASLGFLAGGTILFPLTLAKIVGGGDIKLLAAFGILVGPTSAVSTALLGLIWAAVFGVVRLGLSGQLKPMLQNLLSIVIMKGRSTNLTLHRMPLTVGLLLGWLSHWLILPELGL